MTTWERYVRDLEKQHWPSDADFLENAPLDAYGHLNWTVGNDGWLACFDAVLSPDKTRIAWHCMIDIEHSLDEVARHVVKVDDALAALKWKPRDYYAIFLDATGDAEGETHGEADKTTAAWAKHIADLVAEAKEEN